MKLNCFISILICLLAGMSMAGCSPGSPSQGTAGLVVKLTLEQLAAEADSILVGKVVNITSYQEGKGNIYTRVTLSVEQSIKGKTGGEVVIRVPGGELNGQTMWVEDTPSFQLGERAVVFLDKGGGTFTVVGGFQGKFTVNSNNMVGDKLLTEFIGQIQAILAR